MPYQRAKLYDEVAYSVITESGRMPLLVSDSGNRSYTGFDEKYPIQIYHRVLDSSSEETDSGYGEGNYEIQETTQLIMVVTNKRQETKTKGVDLARYIKAGFPSTLTATEINTTGIDQVLITTGQTNFNKEDIISEEYVSLKAIPAEYEIFTITYQVVMIINKNCLALSE